MTPRVGSPITRCGVMDGDGHFSKLMHPTSKSQPATKRTAWAVMFQPSQPTGYTYKVTQSSNPNSQQGFRKHARKIFDKENCSAKVSVANNRWSWNDSRSPVHAARETGCCPD